MAKIIKKSDDKKIVEKIVNKVGGKKRKPIDIYSSFDEFMIEDAESANYTESSEDAIVLDSQNDTPSDSGKKSKNAKQKKATVKVIERKEKISKINKVSEPEISSLNNEISLENETITNIENLNPEIDGIATLDKQTGSDSANNEIIKKKRGPKSKRSALPELANIEIVESAPIVANESAPIADTLQSGFSKDDDAKIQVPDSNLDILTISEPEAAPVAVIDLKSEVGSRRKGRPKGSKKPPLIFTESIAEPVVETVKVLTIEEPGFVETDAPEVLDLQDEVKSRKPGRKKQSRPTLIINTEKVIDAEPVDISATVAEVEPEPVVIASVPVEVIAEPVISEIKPKRGRKPGKKPLVPETTVEPVKGIAEVIEPIQEEKAQPALLEVEPKVEVEIETEIEPAEIIDLKEEVQTRRRGRPKKNVPVIVVNTESVVESAIVPNKNEAVEPAIITELISATEAPKAEVAIVDSTNIIDTKTIDEPSAGSSAGETDKPDEENSDNLVKFISYEEVVVYPEGYEPNPEDDTEDDKFEVPRLIVRTDAVNYNMLGKSGIVIPIYAKPAPKPVDAEVDSPKEIQAPVVEKVEAEIVEVVEPVKEIFAQKVEVVEPVVEAIKVEIAEVKAPEVKIPEVKVSEVKVSEVKVSEVKSAEVKIPEVKLPEAKIVEQTTEAGVEVKTEVETKPVKNRIDPAKVEANRIRQIEAHRAKMEENRLKQIEIQKAKVEANRLKQIKAHQDKLDELKRLKDASLAALTAGLNKTDEKAKVELEKFIATPKPEKIVKAEVVVEKTPEAEPIAVNEANIETSIEETIQTLEKHIEPRRNDIKNFREKRDNRKGNKYRDDNRKYSDPADDFVPKKDEPVYYIYDGDFKIKESKESKMIRERAELEKTEPTKVVREYFPINPEMLFDAGKQKDSSLNKVIAEVEKFFTNELAIDSSSRILIGVSGGVDSVVLLDILAQLADKYKFCLFVAHFNHNLRGDASDSDADFVQNLAQAYGLPFYSANGKVQAFAEKNSMSIETAARFLRYNFFERTSRNLSADYVATAHTADDSAETFLMNLVRGAGLTGLSGIPTIRQFIKDVLLIRPMINFKKAALIDYANARNIVWHEDESNQSQSFTRNKVRLDLIPKLQEDYSPAIVDVITRTAHLLNGADKFVKEYVKTNMPNVLTDILTDRISIKIPLFNTFDEFIQGEILQMAINKYFRLQSPSLSVIDRILKLRTSFVGAVCEITPNLIAVKDRDVIIIAKKKNIENVNIEITGVGKYDVGSQSVILKEFDKKAVEFTANPNIEFFDMEALPEKLYLRNWAPGDSFTPLGMKGIMKIGDFLTNEKIPTIDRQSILVLATDEEVLWVVGIRINDKYKVTKQTQQFLKAELKINDK